ncbi:MAG TPA: glycosyltransferase [Allosphingosinicella sp.]|jgi:glycosyltransferase involved in cell wall biosynthesis
MSAVRILLCIPNLRTGGAERQVRLLAPRLVQRGIYLSLFSRMSPADEEAMTAAGVTCFPMRAAGNHNPLLALELVRAARASRAQVIHTWLTQMDILGGAIALATRRRWLLSERSSAGDYSGRAKDRLRKFLGRFADAVIANSPGGLEVWPSHHCRILVPNGIDHDGIRHARPFALKDGQSGPQRTILISVARLAKQKGIDRLLRALPRLIQDLPDVLLVLVGDGPELERLKTLAAELDVDDHVLFAGHQPDAWSWVKSAHLYVSASLWEGHPNAVLEAAAAGLPMALSEIAAHRDAMGGGAVYFDADDPDAIANALLTLASNAPLASSIAAIALEAVKDLSVERAADLYADLYRTAGGGSAISPGI